MAGHAIQFMCQSFESVGRIWTTGHLEVGMALGSLYSIVVGSVPHVVDEFETLGR